MATDTIVQDIRNAELAGMVDQLKAQQDRREDFVVPASALRAQDGLLKLTRPTTDGHQPLTIDPTDVMLTRMGDKDRLDLPNRHIAEFRNGTTTDLGVSLAEIAAFDAVVNARLAKATARNRSFLLRTFAPTEPGAPHIGRTLLSDRYRIVDNFDVLMATLAGIQASGVHTEVQGCDLTERRMRVRFYSPAVQYLATEWLKGYRNPYGHGPGSHSGYEQGQEPIVFAGFEVSNGETGGVAFTIVPRIVVQICRNGARLTKHAVREVHLGGRLDHGQITYAEDTQQLALDLVTNMTRDAVASFLDPAFLEARIRELEADSAVEIPAERVVAVVEQVAKVQRFTEAEQESILGAFIRGGQTTAGGVLQAVTAAAQHVPDPERAAELEALAIEALPLAAQLARA